MMLSLDRVTNIATLVTCLAIGVVVFQSHAGQGQQGAPVTYSPGERVAGLQEINFASAEHTLMLVVRRDCEYCEESVPFYRSIVSEVTKRSPGIAVQLVVVTSDDRETAMDFLRTNQIAISTVMPISGVKMRALKVPGTPTLILTDRAGVVEQVWIGKLTAAGEREVLRKLG
jgi:hypothetical protein